MLHCGCVGGALQGNGVQLARKLMLRFGRRLYYGIGHSYSLIRVTLRMLTAMVAQGATAAREMLRTFDFTVKALQTLANKRNAKVSRLDIECH